LSFLSGLSPDLTAEECRESTTIAVPTQARKTANPAINWKSNRGGCFGGSTNDGNDDENDDFADDNGEDDDDDVDDDDVDKNDDDDDDDDCDGGNGVDGDRIELDEVVVASTPENGTGSSP
jgi:hypothetical protein